MLVFRIAVLTLAVMMVVSSPSYADTINYTVPGNVPTIAQPTSNTCWATAATILQSWKDGSVDQILAVVTTAGPQYATAFSADQGLLGSDKLAFLASLNLKAEAPQDYTAAGWQTLLQGDGPLWVTTNEGSTQDFSIHARVLVGIAGDGTSNGTWLTLIDPADGAQHSVTLADFTTRFDQVAQSDLGNGADLRPQVVHF